MANYETNPGTSSQFIERSGSYYLRLPAESLRYLLSRVEQDAQSHELAILSLQQLEPLIGHKLISYIAGKKEPELTAVKLKHIQNSKLTRIRLIAAAQFMDNLTLSYHYDPYLHEVGSTAQARHGGQNDADSFARFIMIGQQPELAGYAPAEFLRHATREEISSDVLPQIVENVSLRTPQEHIEPLWWRAPESS